jgi:hypothetical protein
MRLRVLLGAVGVAMGSFGLLRFLQHDLGDVVDAVLWLAGGVVVHDAIVAPLTLVAAVVGARVLPPRVRPVVVTALVVLLTVTVTAIPVLGSWGARPDNPTLLDRSYGLGWIVLVVMVLAVTVLRLTPAWRRLVHRRPERGGD